VVTVTDATPDWNSQIGPDVRSKMASDVRHAILEKRKDAEFVEPGQLWAESFRDAQPESLQKSAHLGLRCLILPGPESQVRHDGSNSNPFHSSGLVRISLQAILLRWGPVAAQPRLVQSSSQGIARGGWVPGTPLIFTRICKEVDTDGSAIRGLVSALLDEMSANAGDGPLRVAVPAEADEELAKP
jgi:hypothetical protein